MYSRSINTSWPSRRALMTVIGTMLLIALSLVGIHLHCANSDGATVAISISESTDKGVAASAAHSSVVDSPALTGKPASERENGQSNSTAGLMAVCAIVLLLTFTLIVLLNRPKFRSVRTPPFIKIVRIPWETHVSKRSLLILYCISRT